LIVSLRPARRGDLAFVTALERHPDNRELIGQWTDEQHFAAIRGRGRWSHWIIERDGLRAGYLIARDCRDAGAGTYLKRILVADKERGTGQRALRAFVEHVFAADGESDVWLIVRHGNARAAAVYRKLGFVRIDPEGAEAERLDTAAEAPLDRCFRMRLSHPCRSRATSAA
jgi:ribosomal protein S18 acetylase RimI-like enzyme